MALMVWQRAHQQAPTFWKLILPTVLCQAGIFSLSDMAGRWLVSVAGIATLVALNKPRSRISEGKAG